MKKNTMMRIASVLLVAVLLSTCTISGTFAKYVTAADANDSARVAKFGVTVATSGGLFSTTYAKEDTTVTGITNTVVSSDTNKLVAPGTKNDTGLTFSLTGTPEVATTVAFSLSVTNEVYVKAGSHLDYTTGNSTTDTFTLDADYYPVVFTLKNSAGTVLASGKVSVINTYLAGLSKNYDANTNLAEISGTGTTGTYTLTWAWAFGTGNTDKADTLLGNVAAGTATDANVTTGPMTVTFSVSVTQID